MDSPTGQPVIDSAGVEAEAPDWEKVSEDIHCPLCDYNLRGISEPRCPECGYRFVWSEVLDPNRNHPYLFEQARRNYLMAFVKTLVRNGEPGKFWTTLRPNMRMEGAGLFIYWLICAILAALPAGVALSATVLSSFFNLSAPQGWLAEMGNAIARDWDEILLISFGMAVYPLLSASALMLFHESMLRARVLPRHVLRVGVYSGDAAVWNGLWIVVVILIQPIYRLDSILMPLAALGVLCTLILTTLRIRSAYADYMRIPNPLGIALLSQIVVFLTLALTWIPLFGKGIETLRRLGL